MTDKIGMNKIKQFATTGLLTDYFDVKKIPYQYMGNFVSNNKTSFSIGQVRTIRCEEGPYDEENIEMGLGYLDECNKSDVLIIEGSDNFAYFGELMSRLCKERQLSGAVIIGATRDTRFTGDFFPVWARKFMPMDIKGRGRVKDVGKTLCKEGLEISENNFAAIDADGLVLFERNIDLILDDLSALIDHEKMLVSKIDEGMSVIEILKLTKGF